MELLNGYVIIASIPDAHSQNERVILGFREFEDGRKEYVTARAKPRNENPREWHAGHYFTNDIVSAVTDWQARANR